MDVRSFPLDPKFLEPKDWPICQPIVSECSELPTNLHATKALTDLPVSVGQKVTMACARKGMIIMQTQTLILRKVCQTLFVHYFE